MHRCILICLAAVIVVACTRGSGKLEGTKWIAEEVAGHAALPSVRSTLEFTEPERVEGQGGCNRYAGGVKLDETTLHFGDIASTKMACAEPAAMDQESRFFTALAAARSYRVAGTKLLFADESGKVLVRFKPQ